MDAIDQALIRLLQGNMPLAENPYAALGERIGISSAEVLQRLRALKASGRLKRISAVLRHQKTGYSENAMVVFQVNPAALETVGQELAQSMLVSHCYERASYEQWPYNLYAMLHSKDADEIDSFVQQLTVKHGIAAYDILLSEEELKKTSMVYF